MDIYSFRWNIGVGVGIGLALAVCSGTFKLLDAAAFGALHGIGRSLRG